MGATKHRNRLLTSSTGVNHNVEVEGTDPKQTSMQSLCRRDPVTPIIIDIDMDSVSMGDRVSWSLPITYIDSYGHTQTQTQTQTQT